MHFPTFHSTIESFMIIVDVSSFKIQFDILIEISIDLFDKHVELLNKWTFNFSEINVFVGEKLEQTERLRVWIEKKQMKILETKLTIKCANLHC